MSSIIKISAEFHLLSGRAATANLLLPAIGMSPKFGLTFGRLPILLIWRDKIMIPLRASREALFWYSQCCPPKRFHGGLRQF